MPMRAFRPTAGLAGIAATVLVAPVLLATAALAQQAPAPTKLAAPAPVPKSRYAGLSFESKVGSFKMLGAGDVPAQGKLTINFTGTVLVSGPEPTAKITTSGNVLREINDVKRGKIVYHGTGTLVVDGSVRAVQFFGRNLKGRFFGQAIFRLYGEFDKDLNTGTYQFDGSQDVRPWGTGGGTFSVPSIEQATPKPRVRINPGS